MIGKVLSAVFLSLLLFILPAQAQKINTKALDVYWKITDELRKGDTLSVEKWKAFLQLEGNRVYVENQGFDDRYLEKYRKTLQFVYNPRNEKALALMMQDKVNNWMAYKINQYKVHEKELISYASHLNEPAYLDSMYKNAWEWLPENLRKKSPDTQFYFIPVDNDALVQNGVVVFTLWSAYNQDKLKYGILGGHELHHVLRRGVSFNNLAPSEEGIFYVLNGILNEGTADMVDKKYSFDSSKDIVYEYHYDELLLEKADSVIKQIDTCMQLMVQSDGKIFRTEKDFRRLIGYSSGHKPGYYMADVIVRNGYRRELIANIQNPFKFIYLYNKAALKDAGGPPVFSETAIVYCKQLEKKYWKP
jgi:hypothetical protein